MQFSLLAILSFAALAIATPTTGHVVSARTAKPLGQRNVQDAAQACGTKQVPACCNQASKNSADRGILSNILTDVVGLNCVAIPVSVCKLKVYLSLLYMRGLGSESRG